MDTPPQIHGGSPTWQVCTYKRCGLIAPIGASHWLRASHRSGSGALVVRCPWHFTDRALRETTGRTAEMRAIMREAQEWAIGHPELNDILLIKPIVSITDKAYVDDWKTVWE